MFHTVTRSLAVAAVAGAVAAPAATAAIPLSDADGPGGHATKHAVIVRPDAPRGFSFGDAAVGAGAAVVVLLAGGGTLVAYRHRQIPPAARA